MTIDKDALVPSSHSQKTKKIPIASLGEPLLCPLINSESLNEIDWKLIEFNCKCIFKRMFCCVLFGLLPPVLSPLIAAQTSKWPRHRLGFGYRFRFGQLFQASALCPPAAGPQSPDSGLWSSDLVQSPLTPFHAFMHIDSGAL